MKKFVAFLLVISTSSMSLANGHNVSRVTGVSQNRPSPESTWEQQKLLADVETLISRIPDHTDLNQVAKLVESRFGQNVWAQLSQDPELQDLQKDLGFIENGGGTKTLGELRSLARSEGYSVSGDKHAAWQMLLPLVPLAIAFIGTYMSRKSKENERTRATDRWVEDSRARAEAAEANARQTRAEVEAEKARLEIENARLRNELQRRHLEAVGANQ